MKAFPSAILLLALASSPLYSQSDEPPVEQPREITANQQAFLNLPEAQRKEFIKHVGEASRLFQQKRIFETLDELHKAREIFPESAELYNLSGSCYVEFRNFDKALEDFRKAAEISPDNASVEFNIAEVLFVTKEYQKAHDAFLELIKKVPVENVGLGRLVEFKILLCKKKLGMDAEAEALAQKYDFLDDSPYYYYANAALAYDKGELVKAEEWLAMAGRVFRDPNILAPWQDTVVEFGYIKSFYGDDTAVGGED